MVVMAAAMTAAMGMTAFAGQWNQDSAGWYWQDDDGSHPTDTWRWLDGNQDGTAECYYFGSNGYMYVSTVTPDNYEVNSEGQWVENGVVKTQVSETQPGGQVDSYDRENWVGDYFAEDGSHLQLGLGESDNLAAMFEDGDSGDTRVFNFKKVNETQYRDSSNSRTLKLLSDGSVSLNDQIFYS